MLLKLPMMLWSSAPEFCLLCSVYAPYVKYYALQIQHFIFRILLKLQNHAVFKPGAPAVQLAHAWFLKIVSVRTAVYMCACVSVCVCMCVYVCVCPQGY